MMRADVKRDSYLQLAAALGRLRARTWQLLVVGDGPARPEIEAALSRFGRVVFAGALLETELPAYYAAADLYVWPAVREAYGLALLEAGAAGLPVVAGRDGGVAEVVIDGVTGLLTTAGDPAEFAAAVDRLLAEPQRRLAMGEAGLRFVAEERSLGTASAILGAALAAAPAIRAARR
jgi:glycosyltransferase involved in cell wall biosynthesis